MVTVSALLGWFADLSLLGAGGAIAAAVASAFSAYKGGVWINEQLDRRFVVKHVKSSKDRHFEQFLILFERLIEESIRINSSALERAVDEGRFGTAEHRLFFCVHQQELLGFCQVFLSSGKDLAFISYLAVDSQKIATQAEVSNRLCIAVRKFLANKATATAAVLFEVESPNALSLSANEASRRRAIITRFKRLGRDKRRCAYEIDLPYIQPEVPNDNPRTNEHVMRLLAVLPTSDGYCRNIGRNEFDRWLKFIYFDIYGAVYASDVTLNMIYRERLGQILSDIEASCPEIVPLVE